MARHKHYLLEPFLKLSPKVMQSFVNCNEKHVSVGPSGV